MHPTDLDSLRRALRRDKLADEHYVVQSLLKDAQPLQAGLNDSLGRAAEVIAACRARPQQPFIDELLQEFSLSSEEGVLLMCLAESLLRIPDGATADRLIADKIAGGHWDQHRDTAHPGMVNAAIWSLALTGRWVDMGQPDRSLMQRLLNRLGEPVIRAAMRRAMKLMGEHYVYAESIHGALERERPDNLLCSFDMLGEGARSEADASRYRQAYADAIEALGQACRPERPIEQRDGISVKLSALHPRYTYAQRRRVMAELLPRLRHLCLMAREAGIGLTIDAEEADRLDLSLELISALAFDRELRDWSGLGLAVQAYQKRAANLCRWLAALARASDRRLMVRLVKGAYWDTEIKHAQQLGLPDYPVFTRKVHTDLSYLVCARILLDASPDLYPQLATHNAGTLAALGGLAGNAPFELQRLHGMGEAIHEHLPTLLPGHQPRVRVYAPVGRHRELLPYLVRRLLENGANSSFIHHFLDDSVPPETLLADPLTQTAAITPHRHPRLPRPGQLYRFAGEARDAAGGFDLDDAATATLLERTAREPLAHGHHAGPMIVGGYAASSTEPRPVTSPVNRSRRLGTVRDASAAHAQQALAAALTAQPDWDARGVEARARLLDAMADALEEHTHTLMALLAQEAGRTLRDGLDEVREAVDFCRYYALQARQQLVERPLPGPSGEDNRLSLHGRGVFLCISPWNFPLAIFTGQIAAALVAGNTVLAKPAEATPLIAAEAVRLFRGAGLPEDVLQLLPGSGPVIGEALLSDPRLAGVAFTGSTATAWHINRQLAARDGPIATLIAETGGQNAMLVDSTALPEQVVDDVIASAFHSAGQRCSALRVLFVQEDIADDLCDRLAAALLEQRLGDPGRLETDIGPVIDEAARDRLQAHLDRMSGHARLIGRLEVPDSLAGGTFVAPHIFAIDRMDQLEGEVFGPILHVIRFRRDRLDEVIGQINACGYGLTLGVHSRITAFAREVFRRVRVGNTYVNRTMIGAVVGSQPFGGQGLSGTGPKAGGPHYVLRFATERSWSENLNARGGDPALLNLPES